jgi:hypothetical protein
MRCSTANSIFVDCQDARLGTQGLSYEASLKRTVGLKRRRHPSRLSSDHGGTHHDRKTS